MDSGSTDADRGVTRTLADFASQATYNDLPADVVEYTKLVIADTVACGCAAGGMERSRMMHTILESLGGHEQASVFGLERKVPAPLAAMANAEIINCLDADDTFFTSSHFAAFNVAAALAEAQRCGASGKTVILAVAVGFDINARLNLASQVIRENEAGELEWSPVQGMGFASFGTAVSSAIVREAGREQMRNIFGLAGCMAPTPVQNTTTSRQTHTSLKYANYPGTALSGMFATLFAQNGYDAVQSCLDDGGFLRAQGCLETDNDLLLDALGSKWWILETSIKYQPSCRYTHGPIDMLGRLMREENIGAHDIEKMVVHMNPMAYALRFFREPATEIALDHRAPLTGAFNIPYVMALAALGRTPGPDWYSSANLQDEQVWALARKITTQADEAGGDEVRHALRQKIRRFRKTPASMEVWAKGQKFVRKTDYVMGDPWTDETRAGWTDVDKKFHQFCDGILPASRVDYLCAACRDLDASPDVAELLAGAL